MRIRWIMLAIALSLATAACSSSTETLTSGPGDPGVPRRIESWSSSSTSTSTTVPATPSTSVPATTSTTTTVPATTTTADAAVALFSIDYDTADDSVDVTTSSGAFSTGPRELPNGDGSGWLWGVVDFDSDGTPEILTLDPQGASNLWTAIYAVTPDGVELLDTFFVSGNVWLSGGIDCADGDGDDVTELTLRDIVYDDLLAMWVAGERTFVLEGGRFIEIASTSVQLPASEILADDVESAEQLPYRSSTCSPAPADPFSLAEAVASGAAGLLGEPEAARWFDDPADVVALDSVSSGPEGGWSVAQCDDVTSTSATCWLLAEVTEAGLTMARDDWQRGWYVSDVRLGGGE